MQQFSLHAVDALQLRAATCENMAAREDSPLLGQRLQGLGVIDTSTPLEAGRRFARKWFRSRWALAGTVISVVLMAMVGTVGLYATRRVDSAASRRTGDMVTGPDDAGRTGFFPQAESQKTLLRASQTKAKEGRGGGEEGLGARRHSAATPSRASNSGVKSPNVFFFMIDDMGWNDMGYQSSDLSSFTPNLNRLAAEGIKV